MALATTARLGRPRLGTRAELMLVALPTATVLIVFAVVSAFANQRLLFASLASSAFLIYLDPEHAANQTRTLVIAQLGAAAIGYAALAVLGPGYPAAAAAMVLTAGMLVWGDVFHPPAIATGLAFAFKGGQESNLLLFAVAVGMVALLVAIERASLWLLARARKRAG